MRGRLGGEPAGRRTLLEFHCCVCFVAATGHGRREGSGGGEGTVRAYCVDVWREFSINEKRTARHDAAKAMGAAVLVQHATQRKLHTGLCVCQMVPQGMCKGGGRKKGLGSHSNCAFNCQRCALGVQKKLTHSSGDKELANWTAKVREREREREYVQ